MRTSVCSVYSAKIHGWLDDHFTFAAKDPKKWTFKKTHVKQTNGEDCLIIEVYLKGSACHAREFTSKR